MDYIYLIMILLDLFLFDYKQEYLEHHKDRPNEDAENFMFE